MKGGVYRIVNKHDGSVYVGSAVNLRRRENNHWSDLRLNCHGNSHLQNAWNKYSEDALVFEILEYVPTEQLIKREQYYLDTLNPEYNFSPTAGNCLGYKHPEEMRQKVSTIMKEAWKNPEYRQKISTIMKEAWKNPKYRQRISEALRGNKNVWYGRKHSEETLQKISKKVRGDKNPSAKLTKLDIPIIRRLITEGKTDTEIASMFGVARKTINDIKHKKCWKHIKEKEE